MDHTIHIAITRQVYPEHVAEFERRLADFASRSLAESGARGVHCLYPPPGSGSTEYGILRSFGSEAERDAFYRSSLYQDWLREITPLTEGAPVYRQLSGLEAWFRSSQGGLPPRWKMALLTWAAVWPVSMLVPALLLPLFGHQLPKVLVSGMISACIVVVLTWVAMPLLVKIAYRWLHPPKPQTSLLPP